MEIMESQKNNIISIFGCAHFQVQGKVQVMGITQVAL